MCQIFNDQPRSWTLIEPILLEYWLQVVHIAFEESDALAFVLGTLDIDRNDLKLEIKLRP